MTPMFVIILGVALVLTLVRRLRRSRQGGRHRHHRMGWLVARRRRRRAEDDARQLLAALLRGGQIDPRSHLTAGVILQSGEVTWGTAAARLAVRTTTAAWITRTRISWWARRAETVGQEQTSSGWMRQGGAEWLLTSHRLAGRLPGTSELISIWWSTVAGLGIDLRRGHLLLQTATGWRASFEGPGVAPMAVAAVVGCHGPAALRDHPSLGSLQDSDPTPAPQPPRALGPSFICVSPRHRS